MTPVFSGQIISRSTILILCGVLAGIMLNFQISLIQRINVTASVVLGIVAFAVIDRGIQSKLPGQLRKLQETRDTLNRRIEVQKAFLDSQVREMPEAAKELRLKQKREAEESLAANIPSLDPANNPA